MEKSSQLIAGAAEIDISPPINTQVAGDVGRRRPARVVLDPLYAKALILESNGASACIISMDLTVVAQSQSDIIRERIESKYGIPRENVVVHATQTHSAPSLGHFLVTPTNSLLPKGGEWAFLAGGDDRYTEICIERLLLAVDKAATQRQPVHAGASRAIDGRFAHNRRAVMRDGRRVAEVRPCDPDILYIEGPADPEVGVLLLVNDALENIAVLLHHTAHPTSGWPYNYVSSDWPGAWCDKMRGMLGRQCVPMVINGCCGNIGIINRLEPERRFDYKEMGEGLAASTARALKKLSYIDAFPLLMKSRLLKIPMRHFTDEHLDKARKIYDAHPMPKWIDAADCVGEWWNADCVDAEWWAAASALDVYNHYGNGSLIDYEIQALRLGSFGMVALGGEPYVEGQLEIKLRAQPDYVFVAHLCNSYPGYIPTAEAVESPGSWETNPSLTSHLCSGALKMVADGSVELLNSLY